MSKTTPPHIPVAIPLATPLSDGPRAKSSDGYKETPPPIPLGVLKSNSGRKGAYWALLFPRLVFILLRNYTQCITKIFNSSRVLGLRLAQLLTKKQTSQPQKLSGPCSPVDKWSPVEKQSQQLLGISPQAARPTRTSTLGEDSLIGKIIDRYQVISLIDEGAMGTIYKVRHINLQKEYAIKVIRDLPSITPELILRFQQEAKATSKLQHPNCVSTIDFGQTHEGRPYFVMELLEGVALSELLDKPVAISDALEIMHQSLQGLQYAHEAGVIHRDLKPGNIMVNTTPKKKLAIKLIDFGLARHQQLDPTKKSLRRITQARMVFGTPAYMAPELIKGEEADQCSDIYSMGVILFLLLTGRRPFFGDSSHKILKNKFFFPALHLDAVAPGVFSRPLRRLLEKALHQEPEQRFGSADEFLVALQAVQRARGGGLVTRMPFLMALSPARIRRSLRSLYYQISH